MAEYESVGEHIYLVNPDGEVGGYVELSSANAVPNPRGPSAGRVKVGRRSLGDFKIEIPLGEYEDLRVRTALVRHVDYGKHEAVLVASSQDVYRVMQTLEGLPAESMFVLLLNARNRLIGIHQVAMGGTTKTMIEPINLFQAAIVANAVAIILVHNHPSGAAEPGPEDIALSRTVEKAASFLGIKVLDHVIIGAGQYVSLADRGLL
jgi:DNA repair protein RadC